MYLFKKIDIPRTVNTKMINVVFSNFLPDAMVICFPVKITGKIIANNGERKKEKCGSKSHPKREINDIGVRKVFTQLKNTEI